MLSVVCRTSLLVVECCPCESCGWTTLTVHIWCGLLFPQSDIIQGLRCLGSCLAIWSPWSGIDTWVGTGRDILCDVGWLSVICNCTASYSEQWHGQTQTLVDRLIPWSFRSWAGCGQKVLDLCLYIYIYIYGSKQDYYLGMCRIDFYPP